jgi:hypothetical protein
MYIYIYTYENEIYSNASQQYTHTFLLLALTFINRNKNFKQFQLRWIISHVLACRSYSLKKLLLIFQATLAGNPSRRLKLAFKL